MGERQGLLPSEVRSLELPSLLHPFKRDAAIRMHLGDLGIKELVPRQWGLYLQRSQLMWTAVEVLEARDLASAVNEQQLGEQSNG